MKTKLLIIIAIALISCKKEYVDVVKIEKHTDTIYIHDTIIKTIENLDTLFITVVNEEIRSGIFFAYRGTNNLVEKGKSYNVFFTFPRKEDYTLEYSGMGYFSIYCKFGYQEIKKTYEKSKAGSVKVIGGKLILE